MGPNCWHGHKITFDIVTFNVPEGECGDKQHVILADIFIPRNLDRFCRFSS